jgi:hypothetical protein
VSVVIIFGELLNDHHLVGLLRKDLQTGSVTKYNAGKLILLFESYVAGSIYFIDL